MQKPLLFIAGLCLFSILLWWKSTTDARISPVERWMELGDSDRNGKIDGDEYARISDSKTPFDVLDVNQDGAIEVNEMEGFFLGVDPVDLIETR